MIHAYYEIRFGEWGWCHQEIFKEVCNLFLANYPNDFKVFDSVPMRLPDENTTISRYGTQCLSLVNPENGKYFLVSTMDFLHWIRENPNFDIPNIVEIFATVGIHKDVIYFEPGDIKATQFSNVCSHRTGEEGIEECRKKTDVEKFIYDKPTLYGGFYAPFRQYLSKDPRFDIQLGIIPNRKTYVTEHLFHQKLCLSLNGGEMSQRDVEIMGLGNASLRPKYRITKPYNPLIPNFHYIAVEHEDIPMIEHEHEKYWKELADRIIDRWNEVKGDDEFLRFIGENGRKWYEENGTVKKTAQILYNLIDINKLK